MISLPDLQRRMYTAIMTGRADLLDGLVGDAGLPAADRLRVYRNNARETFRKNLAGTFPVIERLVGADCFAGLAAAYMCERPSRHGDLHWFARHFPQFLAARYRHGDFEYLGDVARFEWVLQQVAVAIDEEALDPQALADIPAPKLVNLRLRFRAASRLVRSPFPVLRIWQANQPGADEAATIDLGDGGDQALVWRGRTDVMFRPLDPAQYLLLCALRRGSDLGSALDAVLVREPGFTLDRTLSMCFRLGLVTGFSLSSNRSVTR